MEDGLAFGIEGKETTEELLATLLNDDLPSVFTNEPCYSGGAAFFDNVQAADSTVEDSDESSLIQQECQKIGLVIPEAGLQMSKSEERSFKQVKRRVKSRLTAQANRQKRKKLMYKRGEFRLKLERASPFMGQRGYLKNIRKQAAMIVNRKETNQGIQAILNTSNKIYKNKSKAFKSQITRAEFGRALVEASLAEQ